MTQKESVALVEKRIQEACARVGRSRDEITLVAVSKKQPIERVNEYLCLADPNRPVLGENYVQEYEQKRALLVKPVVAHLIGPLQSNKVRKALHLFDVIETVHSEKVLSVIEKELSKDSPERITKDFFLQVNISEDPQKSGFAPAELKEILSKTSLQFRGLMTITEFFEDPEDARPDFRKMKVLAEDLARTHANCFVDAKVNLSMGMSADFDIAIEEGADFVRVGTALFGERAVGISERKSE